MWRSSCTASAAAATATTTSAKTATTSATATVATAIAASVVASIVTPVTTAIAAARAAIVADSRRVVARRVVAGCKILRRRSVGFGLTFVQIVDLGIATTALAGQSHSFFAWLYGFAVGRFTSELWLAGFGVLVRFVLAVSRAVAVCRRQRFAGQQIGGLTDRDGRSRGGMGFAMTVAVIVVFEIFENIAHVQEGIAIQADVHESGLHAW